MMAKWRCRWGSWWMVQIVFDGWLSLGVHVDYKHRRDVFGHTFGPYVDFHLGKVILSLGWHPNFSSDLERVSSIARGGSAIDGTGTVY
jgi:hypothetical protein